MPNSSPAKRKSGISLVGDMPWGTHFCQFYSTKKDLLDILVPYFKAGLENNEFCAWVIFAPIEIDDAKRALKKKVPDLESRIKSRQMRIIPQRRWSVMNVGRADAFIASLLKDATLRGFEGLRFAANALDENKAGKIFVSYGTNAIIRDNVIAAFAYPRESLGALGLMDVVKKHRFALLNHSGRWEVIESSQARVIKEAVKRSEEKLRSVFSNMSEGFAYNRVILDDKGRPCDFVILELNNAFHKLTGLKAKDIIGKRITRTQMGKDKGLLGWIEKFGQAALSGKPARFEAYSEALKRWYAVSAFSSQKEHFAVIFNDITKVKEFQKQLAAANEELAASNEELAVSNEELRQESEERQKTEELLRNSQAAALNLVEDANAASFQARKANLELQREVAERKRAEALLTESRQRYRALFEQSPAGVIILDPVTAQVVEFNDKACKQLGYTREEFERLGVIDYEPGKTAQEIKSLIDKILKTGEDFFETKHRTKNGELRDMLAEVRKISFGGEGLILCVYHDITLSKKLQADLEEARIKLEVRVEKSGQRISRILEDITDGFFALDKDWRFTYVNSAAERIMGVRRDRLLGRVEWEIFPETKNIKEYEEYLHYCMIYRVPVSFETVSMHTRRWMEVRAYPSEDGISVYFKDISEKKIRDEQLKEAQTQLERSRRLSDIGTLAATVAHELRNPLAAIRMAAYNIKRKTGNPLLEKHFSNIDKKISESDQIINNLLFYSRLKEPHYESVNLHKVMDECLEIANKRSSRNIAIVRKKYRALKRVSVEADILQMKELFCNILNNAYDACLPGIAALRAKPGTIEIGASRENASVSIYVKDTGVGMDEEHLRRAHEPFFTTKAKGTGLGLTVCSQIVNLHNGKLELKSEKERGTTVSVTLPIKRNSGS